MRARRGGRLIVKCQGCGAFMKLKDVFKHDCPMMKEDLSQKALEEYA